MDGVATKQAVARAVGAPPTSDAAMSGWVYLPGEHSRARRVLEAGDRLREILEARPLLVDGHGLRVALDEWSAACDGWRAES